MRLCSLLVLFFASCAVYCQDLPKPLTHVDACKQFSKSVVRIDTADGRGSGFIVSSDGFILTAAHIVIDKNTGQYYRAINVTSPHSWSELATPVLNITEAGLHDFALLKINKTDLQPLDLGDENTLTLGEDLSIIGFPFSALDEAGEQINIKFCLAGSVAATASFGVGKSQVDVILFQGVSVKGISGSPIISHKTGQVVGVVNTKLTGIGKALQKIRDDGAREVARMNAAGVRTQAVMNGIDPAIGVVNIIEVLDQQLANGLGSGTGAADAAYALTKAKREYERKHSAK